MKSNSSIPIDFLKLSEVFFVSRHNITSIEMSTVSIQFGGASKYYFIVEEIRLTSLKKHLISDMG